MSKKKTEETKEEPLPPTVILTVKPAYAEKILEGDMQYVFQRRVFKKDNVERVILYTPANGLVGEFEPGEVYSAAPKTVWTRCREYAGIERKEFLGAYGESKKVHAIEVTTPIHYSKPIDPSGFIEGFNTPKPFTYLQEMPKDLESIINRRSK